MKINGEHKSSKKKNKNRKRSKKRKANKKRVKYPTQVIRDRVRYNLPTTMNGDCYWENYSAAIKWQRHYLSFISNCNLSTNVSFLKRSTLKTPDSAEHESEYSINTSSDVPSELAIEHQYSHPNDDEEEEEFEVTEEMMDFIEQSMKHKESMRLKAEADLAAKELEEKMKTSENLGRDDIDECQTPREKKVDEERILEMNDLYGQASAMILGMETAIQLTFNRNCDLYKPSFWPCLPLKIKFNS